MPLVSHQTNLKLLTFLPRIKQGIISIGSPIIEGIDGVSWSYDILMCRPML